MQILHVTSWPLGAGERCQPHTSTTSITHYLCHACLRAAPRDKLRYECRRRSLAFDLRMCALHATDTAVSARGRAHASIKLAPSQTSSWLRSLPIVAESPPSAFPPLDPQQPRVMPLCSSAYLYMRARPGCASSTESCLAQASGERAVARARPARTLGTARTPELLERFHQARAERCRVSPSKPENSTAAGLMPPSPGTVGVRTALGARGVGVVCFGVERGVLRAEERADPGRPRSALVTSSSCERRRADGLPAVLLP